MQCALTCKGEALIARVKANEPAATLPVSITYTTADARTCAAQQQLELYTRVCIPLVQCLMTSVIPLLEH